MWSLPPLLLLAAPGPWFGLRVVDDATGRGVPCVELRTVHEVLYVTDNAGWAAIGEPELLGREVWFSVRSHGYELSADRFGYRGARVALTPGGRAEIRLRRINLAERIARLTGAGRWRDSRLLGEPAPDLPELPGLVMGQDSVQVVPYRGRLHWFWGDTNRPGYPLGQFATSGATTPLAIDPEVGIAFAYFVDESGFSRKMIPLEGPGVVWIDALCVVPDAAGAERMVCRYERREGLGELYERGLATFDDATATFRPHRAVALDAPLYPRGQAFRYEADGRAWIGFANAYPMVRAPATYEGLGDSAQWQAYTPLPAGARWTDAATCPLERDAAGELVWAWKAGTEPLDPARQDELVKAGRMRREESPFALVDAESGAPILVHHGSVRWNAHRRAWLMIAGQSYGSSSLLGEIWLAEAPRPEGPWHVARKIITHDDYSFYNPVQHDFLDRDGGRVIYVEGTYTRTFSGNRSPTPRYDYNQMLYRLDLDAVPW